MPGAFPGKLVLILTVLCAMLLVACGGDMGSDDAGAPAAAPPAVSDDGGGDVASGEDAGIGDAGRKIVRNATIDLAIRDLTDALQTVRLIARDAGGFVSESNVVVSHSEDPQLAKPESARISIRVPAAQYDDVMDKLRDSAAGIDSEQSDVTEVTTEYTDLQSRLRNLEAGEAQYVTLLGQAATIDEILRVQGTIDDVRGEIEQVQGRLNVLDDQTGLATINISLRLVSAAVEAPKGDSHWALQAWRASVDVSEALVVVIGTMVIAGAFATLWVVPPVVVGYVAWRKVGPRIVALARRLG